MWAGTRVLFILYPHGLAGTWLMEGSRWICGMKSAGEHASGWSWPSGWLSQALSNFPQVFLTHTQAPLHWPPNSWNCGTSDWEVHLRCNTLLPNDDIPHSQDSAWWRNFSGVTQKVRRPGFRTHSGDSHRQLLNATFEWPLHVWHDAGHQG